MARLLAGQAIERTDVAKNPGSAVALTGSTQVAVAANKDRVNLWLSNLSGANVMWLSLGGTAVASSGLRLAANAVINIDGYSGAVSVIGTAADVLGVVEI